ncbi:MAG: DUF1287 domain-containing protein [Gammaproteobacteria bacterium]|nr:DUF1287 domain-containing protein [Gammaproteobacteria bacterium]
MSYIPGYHAVYVCSSLRRQVNYLPILLALICPAAWCNVDLAKAALERVSEEIVYDGSYRQIPYPNGDVPAHIGVCTDLVIRSYRSLGIDLQQLVHEDMTSHFNAYPKTWGLQKADSNIDHRRVPNLEAFFSRRGQVLAVSEQARDYQPGDIVSWRLGGALPHIGIVSHQQVPGTQRYYMVHNIGQGPKQEDVLFSYPLHGHYRFQP